MNILDAEDLIKGLPDATLTQEAQMPSGQLPQFLVVSEIQRRTDMRKRFDAQQEQPQGTVADQIVQEGIMGMMPQQPMGMPQAMPQQMPQQMPPMGMAAGGIVQMKEGGFLDRLTPMGSDPSSPFAGATVRDQLDALLNSNMSYADVLAFVTRTYPGRPEVANYVQAKAGRGEMPPTTMSASMIPEMREVLDREPYESREARMPMLAGGSDIYKGPMVVRAADALGLLDRFKGEPEPERMAEPMASALARQFEGQYATPDLSERVTAEMLTGAEPVPSRVSESLPRPPRGPMANMLPPAGNDIPGVFDSAVDSAGDYLGQARDYIVDRGEVLSEGAGVVGDYLSEAGDYIADDIRRSVAPLREYDIAATQRISDAYDESGLGAGIGQFVREIPGAVGTTLGAAFTDFANLPPITGAANMLDQLVTGSTDDPLTLGDIFGGSENPQTQATDDVSVQGSDDVRQSNARLGIGPKGTVKNVFGTKTADPKPGTEEVPSPIDEMLDTAIDLNTDASAKLDISDILDQSRKMTQANMLMQLGAGIAGGDLSKGISAAGAAGMKGAQQQQALDIRKRLAEYQAGREDIARGEKTRQFEKTFGLSEDKLDALIEQNASTTQRETLRTLVSLFEGELDQTKKAGYASQIQQILAELRGEPMVVGGMQTGSRNSQDILAQYGLGA